MMGICGLDFRHSHSLLILTLGKSIRRRASRIHRDCGTSIQLCSWFIINFFLTPDCRDAHEEKVEMYT